MARGPGPKVDPDHPDLRRTRNERYLHEFAADEAVGAIAGLAGLGLVGLTDDERLDLYERAVDFGYSGTFDDFIMEVSNA